MRALAFDVLVVGGGPAGLAAVVSASESGARVGLVDDNPAPGGQIWRGGVVGSPDPQARRWLARLQASGVTVLSGTRVLSPLDPSTLLAETPDETLELRFSRLVLATGARELFLPFPGWTLPGVMGAGGLQALVKGGLPVEGKRVVVAGSGPLLLAVAAYLKGKGAHVVLVAEQAPMSSLRAFALGLARYPEKLAQGAELGRKLLGTPFHAGSWVVEAHGPDSLRGVSVRIGDRVQRVGCDYLACGYGLVPNVELAAALGCKLRGSRVAIDRWQRTSVRDVYCAGEATGIGGVDLALVEGEIAGLAASGRRDDAESRFPDRRRARGFAALLESTYALREELKALPRPETIVCRCEDVTYGQLAEHAGWRSAKLQARCGMGPCQGRVCGAATQFLFGWTQDSIRPPVVPARIESLASTTG